MLNKNISLILKGIALGSANVIPGVSGGTIALITGIFERLINAIKSFDAKAIKLIFKGDFKSFSKHTDLIFLLLVFGGVGVAIVSLARIFDFLFTNYPIYIWSFFFGLILASVYFVGKRVEKWNVSVFIALIIGAGIATALSFVNPATEDDSFIYLIACGVVAICSMILPGLSGSFVLILMGNYELIVIDAINDLRLDILFPVMIGAAIGLVGFSHLLSWVLKKFHDQTLASLTGFIFGSLGILWPWKKDIFLTDAAGDFIMKDNEKIITGYQHYFPNTLDLEVGIAVGLIVVGIVIIYLMERSAEVSTKK